MKVEVWSDITCPWCGIGHHRLQAALAIFEHRDEVEVAHRSFLLNKHAPEGTWPVTEHMMGKYGMDAAAVDASIAKIESLAAAEGLVPYRLGDNVTGNTGLAHELLAFASARGTGPAAWARLFRAYFAEAASIFDVESLVGFAAELGLDPTQARKALVDRRYRFTVETDDHAARSRGVEGVPFYLFAGRYALAGAESVETLLRGLELGWDHTQRETVSLGQGTAPSCGPQGCD